MRFVTVRTTTAMVKSMRALIVHVKRVSVSVVLTDQKELLDKVSVRQGCSFVRMISSGGVVWSSHYQPRRSVMSATMIVMDRSTMG